jgi:hypothetical protein
MTIDQVVRHYSISDVDMPRDWKQTDSSVSNVREEDRNVLPITSFSLLPVRIKRGQVQRGGGRAIMRERGTFWHRIQ